MFKNCISPTRTYVVICQKFPGNGYKLRKFKLPEKLPDGAANDSNTATWYYMNRIDFESVVLGSIPFEDWAVLEEVKQES